VFGWESIPLASVTKRLRRSCRVVSDVNYVKLLGGAVEGRLEATWEVTGDAAWKVIFKDISFSVLGVTVVDKKPLRGAWRGGPWTAPGAPPGPLLYLSSRASCVTLSPAHQAVDGDSKGLRLPLWSLFVCVQRWACGGWPTRTRTSGCCGPRAAHRRPSRTSTYSPGHEEARAFSTTTKRRPVF
jgi:hypothetical protein